MSTATPLAGAFHVPDVEILPDPEICVIPLSAEVLEHE
jgi:hypothetical protein